MGDNFKKKRQQADATYDKKEYTLAKDKYNEIIQDPEFALCDNQTKSAVYYNLALCNYLIARNMSLMGKRKEVLTELKFAIENHNLSKKYSDGDLQSIKVIDTQLALVFILEIEIYQNLNDYDALTKKIETALEFIQPYKKQMNEDLEKILEMIYENKLDLFCKIADSAMSEPNYEKAISYYLNAIKVQQELLVNVKNQSSSVQQDARMGDINFNLGKSCKKLMKTQEALNYYNQAREYYRRVMEKDPENKTVSEDLAATERGIDKISEMTMKETIEITKIIDENIRKKINSLDAKKENRLIVITPHAKEALEATCKRLRELVGCDDNSSLVKIVDTNVYVFGEGAGNLITVMKGKSINESSKQNGHGSKGANNLNQKSTTELQEYLKKMEKKDTELSKRLEIERTNYKRKLTDSVLDSQNKCLKINSDLEGHKNKNSR